MDIRYCQPIVFEFKVALITGGGRGIGRGITIALAKAGADVAITDVDHISSAEQQYGTSEVGGLAAAQKTLEEINAVGRRAIAMHADVIRKKDTQHMVAETVRQLGDLNILVCNAGVISLSRVEEMSEEIWDLTLDVNVKGVFLSCQAAIPVLKTQGNEGCIINIASVAGKNGSARLAHYCASRNSFNRAGLKGAISTVVALPSTINFAIASRWPVH